MEEKNRKKKITVLVIGIATLVVLVLGATYAYFVAEATNLFGTYTITAETENVGGVMLEKSATGLSLNLKTTDMIQQEEDVMYYATTDGTPSTSSNEVTIGTASVIDTSDTNYYTCNYTLSITNGNSSSASNMYTAFQNWKTNGYTNGNVSVSGSYATEGQIVLTVAGQTYDFATSSLFPITYNGTLSYIHTGESKDIKASLYVKNEEEINQIAIAGTTININVEVTNFSCSLIAEPFNVPSAPTITASDGVASGDVHTSEFTLTFSGSTITEGVGSVVYYYGTSENNITNTGSTTSSITSDGTYYVKACNSLDTTKCSSAVTYTVVLFTNAPTIGNFVTLDNQSGIYYRVLYNTSGSTYMVLRMNGDLGTMAFGSNNTYNGSTLDTYMNTTFYNTLSSNIKSAIVDNNINQKIYQYYDSPDTAGDTTYTYQYQFYWRDSDYENANLESTTNVGSRHVYALDIEDIYLYMSALKGSNQRIITSNELINMFYNKSKLTTTQTAIWLRSAYANEPQWVWYIDNYDGALLDDGQQGVDEVKEVRPAFLIDLSKINFTEVNSSTISCSALGNTGC